MTADSIFVNCRAYTLWDRDPCVQAIAVREGRILAVGVTDELMALKGPRTHVVDLGGRAVVPGFVDAHIHMVDYGIMRVRSADLLGSRSIEEILRRLTAHVERFGGQWILGHRFDQELLAEGRWPMREDLDRVSADVPVLISRICGHACVVNTKAIEMMGPKLSARQRETGLLTEGAAGAAWELVPPPEPEQLRAAARLAAEEALSKGITTVHCLIDSPKEFSAIQELHESRELPIRVRVQFPHSLHRDVTSEGLRTGSGDEWLRIGSAKVFMDGSMGARTAAMKEPFSDDPENCGELFMDWNELAQIVGELQEAGFQAAVHAIGDRAVEETIKGLEQAMAKIGKTGLELRHRIEHASQMTPEAIERMARLRIPACVQPQFIITDFWTMDRVGPERYRWAYPFRTMLAAGIPLAMGSDCPVERIDPMQLIHRAITRDVHLADERLSVDQTVRAYCLGGAYIGFEENEKGSLEPGKLADFVVLSKDVFEAVPAEVESIKVEMTVIGGKAACDAAPVEAVRR